MFALILAGGVGTRLWPKSRQNLPKQLLPLTGNRTMVQATVDRILPIVPVENIFFATNREYGQLILEQIPNLPEQNIVAEPSGKSTAPCIGLGALHMQQLNPDSVMISLHSDHFFGDEEGFRQALLAAADVAKEGYLVTLGVKPDKPETGYGYIERGQAIGDYNGHKTYLVNQFLEKPDSPTAERFLASGAYYWNSGIFIWQLSTLMDAFKTHMPDFRAKLVQLEQALANGESINAIWETITPKSIDVGIMEQAEKVAVVPMDVGWNDVGSWTAIHEVYQADADGNVLIGDNCLTFDTTNSLIESSDRLIAAIGLDNVVIIDTGDALLICDKDKAQDVKKVVNWLEENNRTELL